MESKELIKQLMPDNWIFNGEEYTQFKSYHEGRIYHTYGWISIDADLDMRIPITPEILEMAGFERVKGKDSIYRIGQIQLYHGSASTLCYTRYDAESYCYLGRTIKYVHELQNLYFALTGTHLKIELK